METEATEVIEPNPAPASETPSKPEKSEPEATAAPSGAAPEKTQTRSDFIRSKIDEANTDPKVPRRAPEGQFKRGPGRPSKAELAAREAVKAKATPESTEAPAKAAEKPAPAAPAQEAPAVVTPPHGVPMGLRAAHKATFGQLPKEWQEEVARLDSIARDAATQVGAKYAPDAKFAQEIRSEIQPYEMMIRAEGGTPQTAIRSLLQTAAVFRFGTPQQKEQALQQIARTYNVPMTAGAPSGAQPEGGLPDISNHPAYQQLAGTVQQLKQSFTQQTQAQSEAQEAANLDAVNAFLAEVDQKGSATHPLDDSLQAPFAQEIGLVRGANPSWDAPRVLAKAYENLSWKEPQLRAVILQRQEAEKKAKEAQELAAKRQAAVSLRPGAPAPAAKSTQPSSRGAFIAEQLAGLGR